MQVKAVKIRITGLVQGVGFRPYIHRLAEKHGLKGYVVNLGGSEVEIHVEGRSIDIDRFLDSIRKYKPPPARIHRITINNTLLGNYDSFKILPSKRNISSRSAIPPDFGICENCLREIFDSGDRRYMYPWNSCAWCGPRYSMMYTLPYDRENISMKSFPLCENCRREYQDINNTRRYHAQGISCSECGPKTMLLDSNGDLVKTIDVPITAAKLLDEGYVIAIKGLGGYHIASIATRDDVVNRVRKIKQRPTQPLALMVKDCNKARDLVYMSEQDCLLLKSAERPILLLEKKDSSNVSDLIAPNLHWLGIMLPYTGLHAIILSHVRDGYLVMTSGNKHGFPMCKDLKCLLDQLGGEIDYIVEHNREIVHRVDDSVVRKTRGHIVMLRRSRGYAPYWIEAPIELPESAALGAELQTAGGVSFEDKIVLTQYIGDLDNPLQLEELWGEVKWFVDQYKLQPRYLVIDMHPGYSNRRIASRFMEKYDVDPIEIQHHCAHALSLIADRKLSMDEAYPAVVVDGAGYGLDGNVWGGEALIVDGLECSRVSHIDYYPLPGGDAATRNPLRILVGILSKEMGENEVIEYLEKLSKVPKNISIENAANIVKMSLHSPYTSSAGRLADALSALLGISYRRTYEGEPAITLESRILASKITPYKDRDPPYVGSNLDPFESVMYVIDGYLGRGFKEGLRRSATVLYWIGLVLGREALSHVGNNVLFTGGASVNEYIALGVEDAAREVGVNIIYHKQIPPGDGGIAAGQLLYTGLLSN
ncbi:MAG: carbamoyltransferase HypF [Desulfurococcales archaeon]|nr:carbamoyltransferase HypF [Desulfurococcales archaeon]